MLSLRLTVAATSALLLLGAAPALSFTLDQVLHYPNSGNLAAAAHADRIAWVRNVGGVRNVFVADGPAYRARAVTQYAEDEGQELTQLTFSPDGAHLVYVRGGDHDENWPAEGNTSPIPPRRRSRRGCQGHEALDVQAALGLVGTRPAARTGVLPLGHWACRRRTAD